MLTVQPYSEVNISYVKKLYYLYYTIEIGNCSQCLLSKKSSAKLRPAPLISMIHCSNVVCMSEFQILNVQFHFMYLFRKKTEKCILFSFTKFTPVAATCGYSNNKMCSHALLSNKLL